MSNMGSSTYYARPEGQTTEWEDILRDKGILPAIETKEQKAKREAEELEIIEEAAAAIDPLEGRTLDELDELEADGAFGDSNILEKYRLQRIEQLKEQAARNKFGRVYPFSRADFVHEVTEVSKDCWVVVLLYKDAIPDSRVLEGVMDRVAPKHKATKFLKIVSDQCIENYPDRNVPTLFLYHEGVIQKQYIGLSEFGGKRVTPEAVEWVLAKTGAVTTELDSDPRDERGGGSSGAGRGGSGWGSRRGGGLSDDDEDD